MPQKGGGACWPAGCPVAAPAAGQPGRGARARCPRAAKRWALCPSRACICPCYVNPSAHRLCARPSPPCGPCPDCRQPAFEWIYGWRPGDSHDPPKLPNRVASAEDDEAARAASAGRAGRKRAAKAAPPPAAAEPAKRPRPAGKAGGSAGAAAGATASGGAAGAAAAAAAAPGAFPDPMSMAAAGMAGMGPMGPFGMPMAGFGPMMMPPGDARSSCPACSDIVLFWSLLRVCLLPEHSPGSRLGAHTACPAWPLLVQA